MRMLYVIFMIVLRLYNIYYLIMFLLSSYGELFK
jgi:hypothetical protein